MYREKLHTMALVWGPHRNNPRLLSVLFCLGAETGKDSALASKRKASQDGAGHFASTSTKRTDHEAASTSTLYPHGVVHLSAGLV